MSAEALHAALTRRFKWTEVTATLHDLQLSDGRRLLVVGDPDNAAHEWALLRGEHIEQSSDAGYGGADVALRDGLIAALGAPEARA